MTNEVITLLLNTQVSTRFQSWIANCQVLVEVRGFEPLTPWLQTMCSANWATPPINNINLKCKIEISEIGCGGGIWTRDLWVMSPTSYRTAPPRAKVKPYSKPPTNFSRTGSTKSKFQIRFWKMRWWAWVDSNYRPHAYQACALTNWATGP
jgi:hypothetical protein